MTEDVVTPRASFIALDVAPQQAYANIQALRTLYVYRADGLFDAVNPAAEAVGHRDLVLDQSMIMAALNSALENRALQPDFARDPGVLGSSHLPLDRDHVDPVRGLHWPSVQWPAYPGGKLPMSFPRDVGQIPISYNELPTGRPYDPNNKYTSRYLDVLNTPQYPFGYGLSYTTFALSDLHLSSGSIPASGALTVTADITNTGTKTGDDVVQLYVHESGTSILQPVRRLEGFQRLTLRPGQAQTVTFKLGPANLGFYNNEGQFAVEPGGFDVWVGDSSVGGLHDHFTVH